MYWKVTGVEDGLQRLAKIVCTFVNRKNKQTDKKTNKQTKNAKKLVKGGGLGGGGEEEGGST